ncbi:efflux RND transporter periplasmic adaptor subunit [Caldovatus sediminis]|nr:efflux RND transporter periplasmic adaptor subunit [Caldovatus sediminis]
MPPVKARAPFRALLVCLLLAAGLLAGPAMAQFGAAGPPAVGVVTAERRPVTERTEFVGRIEAIHRVDLRARITGFLEERLFEEGQEVRAGEPLFRIERAPYEAQLEQARANLASAQATLENARVALARARELRASGAGTQAQLDNAIAQERTADAGVLAARAAVRVAEISLGYTEIAAPIDGKIGRSTYSVGNVVGPQSEPLATIVSQDPMRVAFHVSQRQSLELRSRYDARGGLGATVVRVQRADGTLYPHAGRIDFIDTQLDRNTDTILVRAAIPNPPHRAPAGTARGTGARELIDGEFVTVFLEGAEPVQAVVIPRAAVLQDQGGSFVFVVGEGNRAERRNVRLGRGTAEVAVVEEGLSGGETVIAEGLQRVRPGQPVDPAPAAPAGPPAAAGGARPPGPAAAGRRG